MADHVATLHRFYQAFAALDAETMGACYAPDARFRDEVFALQGSDEIAGMWRMLCAATAQHGRDVWQLGWRDVAAAGDVGTAHWEARYRFSATGRMVLNRIDATMRFDGDGRIVDHVDRFDFWAWSRQALGAPGLLLGWTPFLRSKVKAQARRNLDRYLQRTP